MKYAMDVKVNLKPIFSNLIHIDWWEGPCRVGPMGEGAPGFERRVGKEQLEIWYEELQNSLDLTRCNLMNPVYMEFDEDFVMRDFGFDRLVPENHQVDLYLITYHVPGTERLSKPASTINLGPTLIDLMGYYEDVGLEAYIAHDCGEYNRILTCLRVRRAVANTKISILSNSEQTPALVSTNCYDLVSLFTRYDIRHNRVDFKQMFNYFDEIPTDKGIHQEVKTLVEGTDEADITGEYLCSDLRYFHAMHRMMERYDCNALTTPCKELCVSCPPQKNKCVPYITHSLNKDDRVPSTCEEDLAVWMAMMMMVYLTRQNIFMGNPVLVFAGNRTLGQLGIPKLLTQPGQVFDHDVLEIHHAVPVHRIHGLDQSEQKYELTRFTARGWGAHYRVGTAEEEGQVVTFGRFNRQGIRMMVAVGHTLGCEFHPVYCSPAMYYKVESGVREFRQTLTKGGYRHHQAIIYGNHVKKLQELGEIVGFEAEVFH